MYSYYWQFAKFSVCSKLLAKQDNTVYKYRHYIYCSGVCFHIINKWWLLVSSPVWARIRAGVRRWQVRLIPSPAPISHLRCWAQVSLTANIARLGVMGLLDRSVVHMSTLSIHILWREGRSTAVRKSCLEFGYLPSLSLYLLFLYDNRIYLYRPCHGMLDF